MSAKKRAESSAEGDISELTAAVNALRDEVRVLRESIDEFRTDFIHLLRNLPDNLPPPYRHLETLAAVVEPIDSEPAPAESESEIPRTGTHRSRPLF